MLLTVGLAQAPAPQATVEASGGEETVSEPRGRPEPAAVPSPEPASEVAAEPAPTETPEPAAEDEGEWEDEGDDAWSDDEAWDDDYDPLLDSPEALQAQRRVVGGAVLIGVGALASFGALAMGLSDPCANAAGNSCSETARNRAALTMGLPGVAALATGVVMVTLGVRQRKALRVDATASRSGGGLVLSGRF